MPAVAAINDDDAGRIHHAQPGGVEATGRGPSTRSSSGALPDPVLAALREQSDIVLQELAAKDAFAKRVHDSFASYRDQVRAWSLVSEVPYFQARA
jgi:hypothetical protein